MAEDAESLLVTPRFRVERLRFVTAAGRPAVRDVVRHPGSVVVLPLLPDGRLVMIRNLRRALGERLWELPAGTLEPGEAPLDCARRELAEETGYRAGRLEPLLRLYPCPGFCDELMHCFVATDCAEGAQSLDVNEEIDVEPLSVERVEAMIREGEIEDAKTVAVVLFWRCLR